MLTLGAFTIALGLSIWISNFYPERLAEGVSRIFEYFATILPDLQWDQLFEGRDAQGNAVPGSITPPLHWFKHPIILDLCGALAGKSILWRSRRPSWEPRWPSFRQAFRQPPT